MNNSRRAAVWLATLWIGFAGALHAADPVSPPAPETSLVAIGRLLKERCARCHQAGSHEGLAPAGGFGDILALDELARDLHLVEPGNPDGSRLLAYLLDPRHPGGIAPGERLSPADGAALRAVMDWIAALPTRSDCAARPRLTSGAVNEAIERWLKVFGHKITRDTRFVTLANLFNDCAAESETRGYRLAVDKILNGFSWREGPVRTRAIDGTGAVLAVRLGDLGWDAARWDRLAEAQPAGLAPEAPPSIAQATGARWPIVRADWLADAASRPPLYYDLLDIPDDFEGFARRLRVAPNSAETSVAAQVDASRVTGGRRTIERRVAPAGPVWIARDYLSPTGQVAIAAAARSGVPTPETANPSLGGVRALFTLPNGFLGSAIFAPDGRRRERVATDLDQPVLRTLGPTYAGRSCLACHGSGVVALPRDPGHAAPPEEQDLARLLDEDRLANRSAMIRAGIDPDATLDGREIIDALGTRYRGDVSFARVAAELGTDAADLASRLATLKGDRQRLAIRLRQGRLARGEANILLAELSSESEGSRSTPAPQPTNEHPPRTTLTITSDKAEYRVGDRPRFTIETDTACFLTLISVNVRGTATVLLPNDFDRENAIKPREALQFPATTTRYDIRFVEPGRETVVALCEPGPEPPAGIEHRFAVERFTILGDWRDFLAGASSSASRPGRGRRKRSRHEDPLTAPVAEAPPAGGRTAIIIDVRP